MAGWIKLWRKLKEEGHLKMPDTAFKLWIYCLLEAAPYPDRKRDLTTGELWLSYQGIKENMGNGDKKLGMSTISAALKYLEQHGYVTLQREKFKGIKARIINWSEYPIIISFPAAETPVPAFPTAAGDCRQNITSTAADIYPRVKTLQEVDEYRQSSEATPSPGASHMTPPSGADEYRQSSHTTPPPEAVRDSKPDNGAASSTAKKYIKNNIKNSNLVVVDIASHFETEFGRPLSPIELNQLVNWQKIFSADLLKEALLRASLQDKHTIAYIGGILKNWQQAGINTPEEARYKQTRQAWPNSLRQKGGKRNARSKPGYRPSEVDWANEPDTL